jgi:hypothetical protein
MAQFRGRLVEQQQNRVARAISTIPCRPSDRLPAGATGSARWSGKIDKDRDQTTLALQLLCWEMSESMGNHDSKIVDAGSVD